MPTYEFLLLKDLSYKFILIVHNNEIGRKSIYKLFLKK
jgi:hypothetical protein